MISRIQSANRAVTLTELLVVLAILSLLATIAVPVYIQKSEQARVAVARQETREIAEAEDQVFALYGFYVPIHLLDNVPDLPTGQTSTGPRDDFENDPALSNVFAMDPLASLQSQVGGAVEFALSDSNIDSDPRLGRLVNSWTGPFLNVHRLAMGTADQGSLYTGTGAATQLEVSRALTLDPWGRPYRIYSPLGVAGNATVTQAPVESQANGLFDLSIDDGRITNNDQRFDRWAIVSFGRDGITDTGKPAGGSGLPTGTNIRDDIFYTFGIVVGESFYKAF